MNRMNFAGNDYLGLATESRLIDALSTAARTYGISTTSSRWALGWTDLHQKFEDTIAAMTGTEAGCILGGGYFGGLVYYSVFSGSGRVVYCDEIAHSNHFLGIQAAGLEKRTFRHLDVADLQRQLSAHKGLPPIVATDGVFSISGELSPLAEICQAAKSVGAEIFIDDAHGFGALGTSGLGALEVCGIVRTPEITALASMGKAMGCNGGFLTGRKELVEKFRRCDAGTGSPPPIVAACLEALRIIKNEPQLRERMELHARRMRAILAERGIQVVCDRTPILGMIFKDEFEAAAASAHFLKYNLVIPYFKYPSEPRVNFLRGAARACYTEEHLIRFEEAVGTLKSV